MSRWLQALAIMAALLPGAIARADDAARTDTLVVGFQTVDFSAGTVGGIATSVDWLRGDARSLLQGAGFSYQDYAGARLANGRFTSLLRATPQLTLTSITEAGFTRLSSGEDLFLRQTFDTARVLSPDWQLNAAAQYVESTRLRTLLARVGANWQPGDRLTLGLQWGRSVNGDVPTRYGLLRADYFRKLLWSAGISRGRGNRVEIAPGDTAFQHYTQFFAGVAIPTDGGTIGFSIDRMELPGLVRHTGSVTLSLPVAHGH